MLMDWLKKAPTSIVVTVIIVCGLLTAVVFASYVILTLNGADTTDFRQWINTLGQILVYPFLGITTAASVSAARSAKNADEQTNGHLTTANDQIDELRAEIVALKQSRG